MITLFRSNALAKYDPHGALLWAKQASGSDFEAAYGISVDSLGDTIIVGAFQWQPVVFGSGEPNQTTLTTSIADAFIAKYGADGQLKWAKQTAGFVGSFAAVDENGGRTLTVGNFSGATTFGPGQPNQTTLTLNDGGNAVVAEYDATGGFVSATRINDTGHANAAAIATDAGGNSHVTGAFVQTVTFGLGTSNEVTYTAPSTGSGNSDIFLARLARVPANQAVTGTGSSVTVSPVATLPDGSSSTVDVRFDTVIAGGTTTAITSSVGAAPPTGFKVGHPPVFYDVSTTAQFEGSITVCLRWTEGQFNNEDNVRLFHSENGSWRDVTSSKDIQANVICGLVTSLSPFAAFEVAYQFTGFFAPVDNDPVINLMKAGNAVPVKFNLGQSYGAAIIDAGFPRSRAIACDGSAPVDAVEESLTAGVSGLNYGGGGNYSYIWKTDAAWTGTCRRFELKLNDGSEPHVALFRFGK